MDNGIVNSFLNVVASCISDYHSFKENHQEIREEELKNNRVEKSNFVSLSQGIQDFLIFYTHSSILILFESRITTIVPSNGTYEKWLIWSHRL